MLSALVSILVLSSLTQNVLAPNVPAQNTLSPNTPAQNALGQNATVQNALVRNATVQKTLAPNASVQSALDTTRLPQPVFAENPGFVELYWKAWNLAWDHVKINPDLPHPRHMDENIREDIIWIWDSEFMAMFCKYAPDIFPGVETLDNFYSAMLDGKKFPLRIQHPDNPSFYPWIEYEYFKFTGDRSRIDSLIAKEKILQRYYKFYQSLKPGMKLPFKHIKIALENKGIGFNWGGDQSGMDNSPRGWDKDRLWVDAISQQALSALYISRLARIVGDSNTEKEYKTEYERLKSYVQKYYWDELDGCFYDIRESDKSLIRQLTPASFWAMLAEIPSRKQAERMASFALADDEIGGLRPWKSLSPKDSGFVADGGAYWRGAIWLPTAYMGVKALEKYKLTNLADSTAKNLLTQMLNTYRDFEPHTIWECYDPSADKPALGKQGQIVRKDFCGWSALGPISLFIENVIGIRSVDAEKLTVDWDIHHKCLHGVRNLRFGPVVTDLIYEKGLVKAKSNKEYTLMVSGRKYKVPAGSSTFSVINRREYMVEPYTLPDPLQGVSSPEEWPSRRAEILSLFEREMYGQMPPSSPIFLKELERGKTFGHLGLRRQLRMWFKPDHTGPYIDWLIVYPRRVRKPVPAIIMLNYYGNHTMLSDKEVRLPDSWLENEKKKGIISNRAEEDMRGYYTNKDNPYGYYPIEEMLSRGYAFVTACYGDVSPDPDGAAAQEAMAYTKVFELWGPRDPSRKDNTTALGAWAWALSRGLDMLEKDKRVDAGKVVVTGSSRLGKAALIAGAYDERFAVTAVNQTGGGGVPLAKRNFGESVASETAAFTHWFCRAYDKYAHAEETLPFDQHMLLSCIAPRPLLVQGFNNTWFDTYGEFLSLKAASPVWEFLGKEGLPDVPWPDIYDESAIGPYLGYVRRDKAHGILLEDWHWLLDFADKHVR